MTITAASGALTSGTDTFTVNAGTASKVVLSGCSPSVNSGSSCTLTATIEDAAGNTVTGYSGSVSFTKTAGTGSVSGLSGSVTVSSGTATDSVTGNAAGSVTITAASGALTSGTDTFTVNAGTASKVVLSGCSPSVNSGSSCTLTATIEDAAGNTVTGYSGSVSFTQTAGTGSVSGLSGSVTVSSGTATDSVTGNAAGSVTITAASGALTSGTDTFTVNAGTASKVVLSGCSPSVTRLELHPYRDHRGRGGQHRHRLLGLGLLHQDRRHRLGLGAVGLGHRL